MTDYAVVERERHLNLTVPFTANQLIKTIPGAIFHAQSKQWVLPKLPSAAFAVKDVGPLGSIEPVKSLRERYLEGVATRDDLDLNLPNIPGCARSAWAHQRRAYWFAERLMNAYLALSMGCGKSLVACGLVTNDDEVNVVVVLAPVAVVGVWPREFRKHFPDRFAVCAPRKGTVKKKGEQVRRFYEQCRAKRQRCVIVVNYEASWRAGMAEVLKELPIDAVIFDEAHRIKAPGGKASRYAQALGQRAKKRVVALSGTPLPHSPLDAYAQYRAVDPTIFGTNYNFFKLRYAVLGGPQNNMVVGYKNLDDFQERFNRICIRVTKEEALDLPEYVDQRIDIDLSSKAQKAYDELDKHFYTDVEKGEVTAANALVRLLRLQQVTSGYLPIDDSDELVQIDVEKRRALKELIEDTPPDRPIVVFCRFRTDLDAVQEVAEQCKRCYGEVSGRRKDLTPDSEMYDETGVLAVQIQSGGVGVDLTKASVAIYYSLGFNLGDYLQSRDRLHRPGQRNAVTYYHLVAVATIDERVYAALKKREDVVESVMKRKGDE